MKKFFLSLLTTVLGFVAIAQDATKDVNIDINTKSSGNWYASPWIWVVGAAVFILLLVALTRGRRD